MRNISLSIACRKWTRSFCPEEKLKWHLLRKSLTKFNHLDGYCFFVVADKPTGCFPITKPNFSNIQWSTPIPLKIFNASQLSSHISKPRISLVASGTGTPKKESQKRAKRSCKSFREGLNLSVFQYQLEWFNRHALASSYVRVKLSYVLHCRVKFENAWRVLHQTYCKPLLLHFRKPKSIYTYTLNSSKRPHTISRFL